MWAGDFHMDNDELLSEGITPGTIAVNFSGLCDGYGHEEVNRPARMIQHFDITEAWSFEGNAGLSSASKFGTGCAEFRDSTGKAICTNVTGIYNLEADGEYEAEFFVKADLSALKATVDELEQSLTAEGYKFYGGHTFKISGAILTWDAAKADCENHGGHLATSTDAGKNKFLVSMAGGNVIWLGATDEATEGAWKWITGETWSYTNWNSGEPNDLNGEDCAELLASGKWNDIRASSTHAYIYEWDYDMREQAAKSGNLLRFGDELTLGIMSDGRIILQSSAWSLDKISSAAINSDTWQHILLRISGGEASVYVDGVLALNGKISGLPIIPDKLTLGGYKGYLDEFVFRHGAGTGNPIVPTRAYELSFSSDHEELSNLLGGNDEGHYHLTREQIEWIDRRMDEELRPKIKPCQTIKVTLGEELSDYQVKSCKTGNKNTNLGGSQNGN